MISGLKYSAHNEHKGGSKFGSCGYELATYFFVVLIIQITNIDDSSKEELKEINFKGIKNMY